MNISQIRFIKATRNKPHSISIDNKPKTTSASRRATKDKHRHFIEIANKAQMNTLLPTPGMCLAAHRLHKSCWQWAEDVPKGKFRRGVQMWALPGRASQLQLGCHQNTHTETRTRPPTSPATDVALATPCPQVQEPAVPSSLNSGLVSMSEQ